MLEAGAARLSKKELHPVSLVKQYFAMVDEPDVDNIIGLHNVADFINTNLDVLVANVKTSFSEWHGKQKFSLGLLASIR